MSIISTKYPIIFSTLPIERMWGGNFINNYLNNSNAALNFGELWLLTDREEAQSVVTNGIYKNLSINYLWKNFSEDIFGVTKPNSSFPLLIKIIDAADNLSLQVHPQEKDLIYLKNAQSKTEMWFVLKRKPQSKIWAGFNNLYNNFSKDCFKNSLNNLLELKKMVKEYSCETGSYYYVPAGTIHSIGKGNLIFEIQENSNTTYRVSDWGRVDSNGKSRELHVKESLQCIDFTITDVYHGKVSKKQNNTNLMEEISPPNPYFKLNYWNINTRINHTTNNHYQFITLIDGELEIICNGISYFIPSFTTVLLPKLGTYVLQPLSKDASLLIYNN